jgi:hypothetical protein
MKGYEFLPEAEEEINEAVGWTPFSGPKQGPAKVEPARLKNSEFRLSCLPEATEGSLRTLSFRRSGRLALSMFSPAEHKLVRCLIVDAVGRGEA